MGAGRRPIHSGDQPADVCSATCAPLASTKADTMNKISPAPAAASLIHMIAVSLLVEVCSSLVLARTQEQNVIEFALTWTAADQ